MKENSLKDVIKCDLYRYFGKESLRNFLYCLFRQPGFRYTYILRKCAYYKQKSPYIKYYLFKFLLEHYQYKYQFQIPPECIIGKGLYLGHFGTIIINPKAVLGNNINIAPGTVIGQTNRGKDKGVPTIGNIVWIGANSVIVGNITIGNNVLIGPGTYVNFNVPNNAVVMGNPAKIVSYSGTENYIVRIKSE